MLVWVTLQADRTPNVLGLRRSSLCTELIERALKWYQDFDRHAESEFGERLNDMTRDVGRRGVDSSVVGTRV